MKFSTAFNMQQQLKSRLRSIYSSARSYRSTSEEITARYLSDVCEELKRRKAPQWVCSYLSGYKDCLYDALWLEMEFIYIIDGEYYSTDREPTDKKKLGSDQYPLITDATPRGHVWRGTKKPYGKIQDEIASRKEMDEIRAEREAAKSEVTP